MTSIATLLQDSSRTTTAPAAATQVSFVHLANPKRRALIRAVGYNAVPVGYLRSLYGPSWGAVQADLRALVAAGVLECDGLGNKAVFTLRLSAFPTGMLEGVLGERAERYAYAA